MARKIEQNDSADPGGFHEFASIKEPGPDAAGNASAIKPGRLPDVAAEEERETDGDNESDDPPTGSQP